MTMEIHREKKKKKEPRFASTLKRIKEYKIPLEKNLLACHLHNHV